MPSVSINKLLKPKSELRRILTDILRPYGDSWGIFDLDAQPLLGCSDLPDGSRRPILCEGQTLGWVQVRGGADGAQNAAESAASLAGMLSFLCEQEAQKKALTGEVLDRYRELSLLYHLSERLASAPQPESIARLAVEETLRTIPAETGLILLKQPGGSGFEQISLNGLMDTAVTPCCLIERVVETGKANLANDVPGEDYFPDRSQPLSLMCAPLKTEKHTLGALVLIDRAERTFTAGDLKLLNTIAMQVAPAIEVARLYLVAVEKARIERELQMARQVQESLLPAEMPRISGWTFAHRWRPAREVSGDFYDLIDESKGQPGERKNSRLGLVIGDVTDKGMPASLFMVFVRSALRASIRRSGTPDEAIAYTNQLICQDSHESLFATLFYARLLTGTGEIQYVNAGHNPPLVYHTQTGQIELLSRTGLLLGVNDSAKYTFRTVRLDPGDFILFYTDGITEATNPVKDEFGIERLQEALLALHACPADQILTGLEETFSAFTASERVADDVTLMVLKRE